MKKKQAHLALLISGLFFGINYWIAKALMPDYFNPLQIVFLRSFVTVILFWIVKQFLPYEKLARGDLFKLAICGLTGISINQLFFFKGLSFTTPVNAAIIHTTSPILVMLFASFMIKERITWIKALGVVLGGFGAFLLVSSGKRIDFSIDTTLGNAFIFLNIISYSFYLVFAKPLMKKYKPVTVMSWVFLFGFLFVIPFSASSVPEIRWEMIPTEIWLSLAYVIIVTTFITYLLTIFGLQHLSATTTGYYIYIQPVVASLIAIASAKESLELYKIIAAMLIFSGIFLVIKDFNLKRT